MPLWLSSQPAILASQSVVRRSLLIAAGVPVDVMPADLNERAIERSCGLADPGEVAAALALAKAQSISAQWPDRLVIGADQTLALGKKRFSKPDDRNAARRQLLELRGLTHTLYSALAVVRGGEMQFAHRAEARLTLRRFSDEFLESYLDAAGKGVMTSVGAYQLEKFGSQLFEAIEGEYFTILGLPLLPLLAYLRRDGYLLA